MSRGSLSRKGLPRAEVDQSRVPAEKTIVCDGPWAPHLLHSSKVEFHAEFFTVTGIGVAMIPLYGADVTELESMPFLVTGNGKVYLFFCKLDQSSPIYRGNHTIEEVLQPEK